MKKNRGAPLIRVGPIAVVAFEQRLGEAEGVSHADIVGRVFQEG